MKIQSLCEALENTEDKLFILIVQKKFTFHIITNIFFSIVLTIEQQFVLCYFMMLLKLI